jgi:myo-inositol-1(or 4)-monophosphatase
MSASRDRDAALEVDWLALCRRAHERIRVALARYRTVAERSVETGRGQGGDRTLVIDRDAEDVVFAELEALGLPLTAVSEERGELELAGGGPVHVVVDPVDGSLNAKRGLPFACLSIAVASGRSMGEVEFAYVGELEPGHEWWARRGKGAFERGEPLGPLEPGDLEVLGLEIARPPNVAAAAAAIGTLEAKRVRGLGSVAATMCLVASGALDAMVSLGPVRSVDAAAAQLVVVEAGGVVAFPEAGDHAAPLGLDMRSRVLAARDPELLRRLGAAFEATSPAAEGD